jgi:osmotically-inducible protein OsmY
MKTDDQLKHDVLAELEWEPSVDHAHIGVAVQDRVIMLSGQVNSYAEKLAAEAAARRVVGVQAIAEEIAVRYPSDPKTSDAEIAKRIVDLFRWDVMVPNDKIGVKVEKGWVTLTGTVDRHYQSEAARTAVNRIHGVHGISNLIALRKMPASADVRQRIEAAFKRNADLDADAITVVTEGNKVRLGGRVHAWREREIAERAAWAAPGVAAIEDNIVLA